jgi:lipopolysaccharide export system permease protein
MIQGGFDDRGVHFDGRAAYPDRQLVMQGRVTLPADAGGDLVHLSCQEMYYRPPVDSHPGGWWLNGCTPPRLAEQRGYLREVRPGEYFIETNLSFERLTRRPNWFVYLDTGSLLEVVDREEQCPRRAEVIATLHGRVTRPLAELLIVLISLPLLVGCPQRSLYIKVGSILALFAASQVLDTVSFGLARNDYLNPSLAAWLPVLIFGPWSLAACDATRT